MATDLGRLVADHDDTGSQQGVAASAAERARARLTDGLGRARAPAWWITVGLAIPKGVDLTVVQMAAISSAAWTVVVAVAVAWVAGIGPNGRARARRQAARAQHEVRAGAHRPRRTRRRPSAAGGSQDG